MRLEGYSEDFVGEVHYEWDIETFEEDEDEGIIDHNHSISCPGIPTQTNERLVLIRDLAVKAVGEKEPFDLISRAWAYVENDKLPSVFESGAKVPQRFHVELKKKLNHKKGITK